MLFEPCNKYVMEMLAVNIIPMLRDASLLKESADIVRKYDMDSLCQKKVITLLLAYIVIVLSEESIYELVGDGLNG